MSSVSADVLPGAASHHVTDDMRPREIDVVGRKTARLDHATLYYTERSQGVGAGVSVGGGTGSFPPMGDETSAQSAAAAEQRALDAEYNAAKRFRKTVLVIYNGGTIGMAPDPRLGGELAPMKGYLTRQMLEMSDLQHPSVPFFDVLEYDKLIDSSDMAHPDWIMLAKDLGRFYYRYDAFVIAHGTDTMHYTACALSFALRNLAKPVIITGSMVPLREVYNDARRNIKMALLFAGHMRLCEVCVCFSDVLLRGTRCLKINDHVAAFESPNFPPLGTVTSAGIAVKRDLLLRQPRGRLRISKNFSTHVLCLTVTPGDCLNGALSLFQRSGTFLKNAENKPLPVKVLVLRVAGGDGGSAFPNLPALQRLSAAVHKAGCLMVLTNSAPHGGFSRVARHHISKACPHALVLSDMTGEAATVKAMYLLPLVPSMRRLAELMASDLRGEMTLNDHSISHL